MQAGDRAQFETLRRQAQFLLQAKRYNDAMELALKAIALFPEDPRPYVQIAYALARQNRPEASEWVQKAIAKDPENVEWRVALSDSFTLRSKWRQALKPMREAVDMNPTSPRLHSMLGLILLHRRKPREALRHLERSLELDPTSAITHQRISLAYRRLFKRKLAEEHLRKALELQPDNPTIQNTLGWHLLNRGRRGEAEEAFSEALRLDPKTEAAKIGLGAPDGLKKSPVDALLRASLRTYSIPYKRILLPMHAVLMIELPWQVLTLGGSLTFRVVSLTIAVWSTWYVLSFILIRVIARRRGVHFV